MERLSGDGLIVWYDLMSTDPDQTDRFYDEVFGWEVADQPNQANGYRPLSLHGVEFGGTMPWDAALGGSSWMPYVQVSDAASIAELASSLGATIHMGATEVPGVGSFVVLSDPTGAPFYLFDLLPARRSTASGYDRGPGYVVWNELITTDVATARSFYEAIAGWEMTPMSPDPLGYLVAKAGRAPVAGLFQPSTPPAQSSWVTSFHVDDIDATIANVERSGGRVIHPANAVPGVGRTAWVADPTGAIFGLMQPEPGWLDRL